MSGTPITLTDMPAVAVRIPLLRLRRWVFMGLVAGTGFSGLGGMFDIMLASGFTVLEGVILFLFAVTFSWIAIAFWNAVIGWVLCLFNRDPLSLGRVAGAELADTPLTSTTALVMPINHEDPEQVMAGITAMVQSVIRTGQGAQFGFFLLSDTRDPVIVRQEETAWAVLRQTMSGPVTLTYRRRLVNHGRKAGNIADFCREWGARYDYMVVLDADSIMTGSTLVALVRQMEANPQAGLVQTVPIPARRRTLFGRFMQFAASVYSPMLAAGQSFWQGDAGNYWGHNAIVRVQAFTDCCRLPALSGAPPFGGAILSHDFVEAALLRQGGWHVYLAPGLGGSYEDVPSNLVEYVKRDRRWTQGSLQHLRLVLSRGLHMVSRCHFVLGAMGYVSSFLWFLMLLASTAYVLLPTLAIGPLLDVSALLPWLIIWRPNQLLSLLAVTLVLLFLPKLLALSLALVRNAASYGGPSRLVCSALLEMLFAVILAPVMMLYHTRGVLSVLTGHTVTWDPQVRDDHTLCWRGAWTSTWGITLVGLAWASATWFSSPIFFVWLTPIFFGLLCAAPLTRWSSSQVLGDRLRCWGLLVVPSDDVTESLHASELQ